jgi:hypothetical protein
MEGRVAESEQAITEAEGLLGEMQAENNALQQKLRELKSQHAQQLLESQ